MNTILRIDIEPYLQLLPRRIHILINPRRAKPIFQTLKLRESLQRMLLPVLNLQMHRLVLLMIRARATHTRQDIETQFPVGFLILDFRHCRCGFCGRVVAAGAVRERPGCPAAEDVCFEAGVEEAAVEAEGRVEGWAHVADGFEFGPEGGGAQGVFVVVEEDGGVFFCRCGRGGGSGGRGVGGQGGEGGVGGEHA